VARAAVEAGADIVNDVSGGLYDPDMLSTVADLEVPMIIMHMRGTPQTMQTMTQYNSGNVVDEVAAQLASQSQAAEQLGIHKWQQIIDPGIGFAKDIEGNLSLLKHTARLREAVGDLPMLLGTSRKGFIGKLAGVTNPEERDYGTIASCVAALCLEQGAREGGHDDKAGTPAVHSTTCNILRVHNVAAARQAVLVMDAIRNAR
jgi:dihydropteroate synthase